MSETQKATQRVGQLLKARYCIERVLHLDAQTCVYAGLDTKVAPQARVAIKLLLAQGADDRALQDRFIQRGYLANGVGHPSAVTVLDAGVSEDGAAFLVTELFDAPTLEQLRETHGGKLALRLACAIVDQCLDMLTCAHPQQIIHGSLTPEHLFWTRGSQLKVLGFGAVELAPGANLAEARDADLRAVAALGLWLVGGPDAAAMLPQSIRGVFDASSAGDWQSAEAMRRALWWAHRAELGSRITAGMSNTTGAGLDAPMFWLWIWLSAAGLAVALQFLSSLGGEPDARPSSRDDAPPLAEANPTPAAPADDSEVPQHSGAAISGEAAPSDTPTRDQTETEAEAVPADVAPPQGASPSPRRTSPRGPSLKSLQLPMLSRPAADSGEATGPRARLAPVATAHRLCTMLAARRRQEQAWSDADQRAWQVHCQKP